METPDVNVLVRAYRADSVGHAAAEKWLADTLASGGVVPIAELALSALIRIGSHPGSAKIPLDKPRLLSFADAIATHPNVELVSPRERHWEIFLSLCHRPGVHGKVVPDAYYAAIAIERGLTFVTADRGFARFPGLDWRLLE